MAGTLTAAAALSLAAWLYLVFVRGRFWLADQRLEGLGAEPENWPGVVVLVPARNEADCLAETLPTLLDQDYPGFFRVLLVDDESDDATPTIAGALARSHARGHRLQIHRVPPRPPGWVGKMWALETGLRAVRQAGLRAEWVLLTDADVAHPPRSVRQLVAHATTERRDLVSLMVKLRCEHQSERLLIPAFVYFFQQLYPFPLVNRPASRVAAAAGGCTLVRSDALARVGAFATLRAEIIDDCALAARVKRHGSLWLGLTDAVRCVRPYGGLRGVWEMVSRTAFTQLRCSPPLLLLAVVALLAMYALPPLAVLTAPWHGSSAAAVAGAGAWLLAALSWSPTLALYGRCPIWGLALPVAALLYTAMTLDSARRHWVRRGAVWKGRAGAGAEPAATAPEDARP